MAEAVRRGHHGDDAVGARCVGGAQFGVHVAGVGDEVACRGRSRRHGGRRATGRPPARRRPPGRAPARPSPTARSATPASRRRATVRWRRRARGRGGARRPRSGCRRGAAAAAGPSCSRRSWTPTPIGLGPPSRITSRRGSRNGPRSSTTCCAVVGLTRPNRFADGAATASPVVRSSASVSGWAGARRPTVSRPPVTASGTRAERGSSSVSGPGQHAAASTAAAGGTVAAQSWEPRRGAGGRSADGRAGDPWR